MLSPAANTAIRTIDMIAAPFAYGANDPGCALGPEALRRAGIVEHIARLGAASAWRELRLPPFDDDRMAGALAACRAVADETERSIRAEHRFLVLGGDHSIAAGTWAGAARALRPRGELGLIWIDAHLDAHLPETSPTGNLHGMPLAALLGAGLPEFGRLAGSAPALNPRRLVIIGARSFEVQEAAFLARSGVRIYGMAEVASAGLREVLTEAIATAASGAAGFGISLDVDALDPREAPGVGTPVPGGIDSLDLMSALLGVADLPGFCGIEIAEYNPLHDGGNRTATLVSELTLAALATGAHR
jgi:arginase